MIEKIKSALKTKYPSMGFSDEAFNGVASLVSKIVTDESQIVAVVDGAESSLKGFQGEVDRRVNVINGEKTQLQADKLALEEKLKVTPTPPVTPVAGQEGDSKILEVVQELQKKIEGFETKQTQEQMLQSQTVLKDTAKKSMLEKGITESSCDEILKNVTISEGETVETLTAKGVEKNNHWQSLYTPQGGQVPQPQGGGDPESVMKDFFAAKKAENESQS